MKKNKSLKKKIIIESTDSENSFSEEKDPCNAKLELDYQNSTCEENNFSLKCDSFLLKKELMERNCFKTDEFNVDNLSLYPNLNDALFNIKIAEKKEFNSTKYDGSLHSDIKEYAEQLSKVDFELQPHQSFVKNFLSSQTPYNSLLLYHALGSGKTLSAIGVCEETRSYLKQMGINRRILIVASENVQENFKLQLFDERNLFLVDGNWTVKGIYGNNLLREINPMNMKGISREKIIHQIKAVIQQSYLFLGYGQFANYIIKTIYFNDEANLIQFSKKDANKVILDKMVIKRLRNEFDNRLIVIDEIHNIRKTDDNVNKKVAIHLEYLIKSTQNVRLLLLSATPIYNNYKEIIWLLNLMNMNDRRGRIQTKDIFDNNGNIKDEAAKQLLIRKATGYISVVRGENPYTFPFRIYPNYFAKKHTFPYISYPKFQMNGSKMEESDKKRILHLYINILESCNKCGQCQKCLYNFIINQLKKKNFSITTKKGSIREMPSFDNMESFGYTLLQIPLESLIISYPVDDIKLKSGSIDSNELTGTKGLSRMMNFIDNKSTFEKGSFEYKKSTIEKYGKIFSSEIIGKYSCKIKTIIDFIFNKKTNMIAEGVILIYSQYIDGGLIPMALALEEIGFTRYGENINSLFKTRPTEAIDARTMKPNTNKKDFLPARYAMITGDTRLSPNNVFEVKGLTNLDNKDGHKIKVLLISKAGSEGIDLKFIRQVHILEPWYNMNRIEQIIGRAVRNFSHKDLPFEKRNVQIFLHGTLLSLEPGLKHEKNQKQKKNLEVKEEGEKKGEEDEEVEAADLYVYRVAELKAIQVGKVTRLLKETAVDCILNHEQTNFTQEKFKAIIKEDLIQELSDGQIISDFKIGDEPFSAACDYMDTCEYKCIPDKKIKEKDINEDTYNEVFIEMNNNKIMQKIRLLLRENFFYEKKNLFRLLNTPKSYPYAQIYSALTQLIEDQNEYIFDKYGRSGHLINIGDYYLFQPIEILDKNTSVYERSIPIDYKNTFIDFQLKSNIIQNNPDKTNKPEKEDVETKKIMKELQDNFNLTKEYTKEKKVSRGDDNWYKHCGIVIKKMSIEYDDSKKYLLEFLVDHMMDTLIFNDKKLVMNYLYSLENIEKNTFNWFGKEYIERNSLITNSIIYYILYDNNKKKVVFLDKNSKWIEAEPEDIRELEESSEFKNYINYEKNNLNTILGFIGLEKNNRYLVFKTKDLSSKRNTGARCDESGKQKTLNLLNEIIGKEIFTKESTKQQKNKEGTIIQEATSQTELCVYEEFLLRYFNKIKKNNKIWFLLPEMAEYLKL